MLSKCHVNKEAGCIDRNLVQIMEIVSAALVLNQCFIADYIKAGFIPADTLSCSLVPKVKYNIAPLLE